MYADYAHCSINNNYCYFFNKIVIPDVIGWTYILSFKMHLNKNKFLYVYFTVMPNTLRILMVA